jgi:uncharacterized protein YydD (DUF2326 family)
MAILMLLNSMKLSKLYCNKPFHNTTFITNRGGVNVILGDAIGKKEGDNSHDLGKTKIGEIIDFMLLSGVTKDTFFLTGKKKQEGIKQPFFQQNEIKYKTLTKDDEKSQLFEEYEFYLEVSLNSGKYLTIKRGVDNPTKIYFKHHNTSSDGYLFYQDWDKNLPFDKAKDYLNEQLDFDFCKDNNESYRRLLGYSIRLQGDYDYRHDNVFQVNMFQKGGHSEWKPLVFSLLGFDGSILKTKYTLEKEIQTGNQSIRNQEKGFGIKSDEKDRLIGKIQIKSSEKELLEKEIYNLNFYEQDKKIIKDLVGDIEAKIAGFNVRSYNIEYDIKKLEQSLKNEFSFDLNKVKSLFEEVKIHFSDQLSKNYEELISFNRQISQERNAQIQQSLREKKQEEKNINDRLIDLNDQRAKFRDLIQDTSLFKRYEVYQKKLIVLERELTQFQSQLEAIVVMENKRSDIEEKRKHELQDIQDEITRISENTVSCELYMSIRKTFSEIVKNILDEPALITIKRNSTYNIDFKSEFQQSAQDEGNTYYKMLCIAFDLAILINYRKKSHFRFVYHDDAIADYDQRLKPKLIAVMQEICLKYDIQYIFSAIKSNLPEGNGLEGNIVLRLNDKDDEGKLFKMSF